MAQEKQETVTQVDPEFINNGKYNFIDISSELWREYHFYDAENENWYSRIITGVIKLSAEGSGHRLFDKHGISYFIKNDWKYITWKAKAGQPNFVK
jgi:hypothetical protein